MSFLRRRGAEVVPPIEVESAPESTEPVDPHAFIGEHEDELYKSAVNWGEIARNVRDFRSEYHDEIKAGLIDVWEANRQDPLPPDENLERETDRFGSTLSVYSFVAARYTSTIVYDPARSHAKAFKDVIGMTRDLFMHIPDHTYNYVLRSKRFPTHRFMMRQQALASAMFEADLHSNSILEGLVHAYEERPNDLRGLSELYADGAAENDRRYQELQSLIAADWYRPDPSQSILRGFCQYLREQPEAYLPDFSEQVVQSERSTRLQAIRQMAAFALIASGAETVTDTGIIETLHRTYSHWDQVADLQQLFSDFVNGKVGQTEQAFQAIAGPRNRKDMRMYPTAEEVEELRQNLIVPFLGQTDPVSRQHRRKASRVQQKAQKRNPFPEYSNL
ncbi:MAG TPA: hypothetical protein VFH39_02680, partial [Candidatus Saccharimonadales bacterium]|nr:hypothetical protein [Candidatus Saccharimonadales bacterium]